MSDYGGFGRIVKEARTLEEQFKQTPIEACPLCGTPVQKNSRGQINCPFGHYFRESDQR